LTTAIGDSEQVVQLKEELQKRGLPGAGKKDELVTRLASAMELEETHDKVKKAVEMVVGKDVSPYVGMRVQHCMGKDHGSSRGLLGTIEIIPGRGALKPDERSVSVRWDADKSDVRGPYYTGEPCDRGSGIGTEKFDLVTLQEVSEEEAEDEQGRCKEVQACGVAAKEAEEDGDPSEAEPVQIEGLQSEEGVTSGLDEGAAAATMPAAETAACEIEEAGETQERLSSPVTAAAAGDERKLSGSKRNSSGDVKDNEDGAGLCEPISSVQALQQRLNQCKQAWTQRMSTDAQSPSPARPKVLRTPQASGSLEAKKAEASSQMDPDDQSRPVRATRSSSAKKAAAANLATPAKEVATPAGAAASSTKKTRSSKRQLEGMPAAMEPGTSLCSSAKKAAQPVGPTTHPHESVQHFRAIISRINAEKEKSDWSASASAALPPRASTSRMPSALASSESVAAAKEEAHASKPITWPPPPLKATGIKLTEGGETGSSSRLTSERLSAHIKTEGKHRMLDSFANSPAVSASTNGSRGVGVVPEASSESMADGAKAGGVSRSVMDAAARQQRAAENRARMEEEMKKKAADQERRRRELENKRLEAEKIAKERRDKEAREQQERLEAAKRRAQEDEERRVKHIQEQEERKRQERERAEQVERERLDREREAKEQERLTAAAAAAAKAASEAAKKPSVPVFASTKSKTPNGGLFGAIGSVFKGVLGTPGTSDVVLPPSSADAGGSASGGVASLKQKEPADQGPTSIKIIESKDSDDSDSEDEKKQPVPLWAQSPNLRRQLQRQIGSRRCPIPRSLPLPVSLLVFRPCTPLYSWHCLVIVCVREQVSHP
jgi:hypothetical protein